LAAGTKRHEVSDLKPSASSGSLSEKPLVPEENLEEKSSVSLDGEKLRDEEEHLVSGVKPHVLGESLPVLGESLPVLDESLPVLDENPPVSGGSLPVVSGGSPLTDPLTKLVQELSGESERGREMIKRK